MSGRNSECENCANRVGCGVLWHPFHDYTDECGHCDGCWGWEPVIGSSEEADDENA